MILTDSTQAPHATGGSWRQLWLMLVAGAAAGILLSWYQVSLRASLADSDLALRITEAERLVQSAGADFLAEDAQVGAPILSLDRIAQWESVQLPHDWLLSGGANAVEHYRYQIDLNVPPDRLWAILLTRVNLNAAVYVNGRLIGHEGRLRDPVAHNWSRPLMFSIPSGLLSVERNEILVQVVSLPAGHGNIGPFLLGPREVLASLYDRQHFYDIQLPRFLSGVSAMLTLVIGCIWLLRRSDTEYGWFALTMALWTLYSLKYHVTDIPVSSQFWAWVLYMGSIGAAVPLFLFLQRLEGRKQTPGQRTLLIAWLATGLLISVLMLLQSPHMFWVANVAYSASLLVALYGLGRITRHAIRTRSAEARWIAATISFMIVFIVYDVALVFGFSDRTNGELSGYAVPLFLLTFGMVTLRRFVTALSEREELLMDLEGRAQAAANRVIALEKQSALAEQRETIMRDMHDGVGGQLVSSLAILNRTGADDQAVLKDVLQGALVDLRLMMDSLDTDSSDLNLLLGALRDRMQPVLRSAGLESRWILAELPPLPNLDAHAALQILRVLQEAITNAIRHANAQRIDINTNYDAQTNAVRFEIADDGRGLPAERGAGGRGLANMQHRAQALSGTLKVDSDSGPGTRVTLTIPGPASTA